jgi:phosphohistidine phosphatase
MQLFVVRHGIAEDAELGQPDDERALTKEGRAKFKQVVQGLRALDVQFERLLTSPWKRAQQTAKLLRPVCNIMPVVTDLLSQPPRAELLSALADGTDVTAVVGHEPWLSELVAWLAFGDTKHHDALDLKKGGVVWLDGESMPGGMELKAFLPPKVLRGAR